MAKVKETRVLRSRILQYFTPEVLEKLKKIVKNRKINNNNDKICMVMDVLNEAGIDYDELGTGTNRTAVFIDGYVFKIALDKLGVRDNDQEFILSQELQPYVIKTYECNGLIMVCEYVVVISREEFQERKPQIRKILEDISQEYLLGDIGTIDKNFANWAFRDNGELVALDYAYIYRIIGDEMLCDKCEQQPMLEYTPDYNSLVCPHCRRKYTFIDIRRRIRKEMENEELETSKDRAFKLTTPVEYVTEEVENDNEEQSEKYTFKFDLGDLLIFREKQKEEKEMGRRMRLEEEGKDFETLVNFRSREAEYNEEDDKSEEEILRDEIAMMMRNKYNYQPDEVELPAQLPEEDTVYTNQEMLEQQFDSKECCDEDDKLDSFFDKKNNVVSENLPKNEEPDSIRSSDEIDKYLQDIIDREDEVVPAVESKNETKTPVDPYQTIIDAVKSITNIDPEVIKNLKVTVKLKDEDDEYVSIQIIGDSEDYSDDEVIDVQKIAESIGTINEVSEEQAMQEMIAKYASVEEEQEPTNIEEVVDEQEELMKMYAMAEEQQSKPVIKIPQEK